MKVVGLVSAFREGRMLTSAVRSLLPLDGCIVFEGPVEGNEPDGPASELPPTPGQKWLHRFEGAWETDAAKRTAMLEKAKQLYQGETWGLWLDGDELLLYGEQLHDWLYRVTQQGDADNPVGGWPISLVELDGSVVWCMGKLVRLDLIRRYLVSSSYIEMMNGTRRTVGNVPCWNPIEGPLHANPDSGRPHWRARPPLHGEPHLQHRPILRDRARQVERQHEAEARNFQGVELPSGVRVNGS